MCIRDSPISEEEKYNLFESAKALAYGINRFIERVIGKLEKAKEEAKKANDYNEVEDLVNEQNLYEGRRNSTFRAMGGLIPEYHSQGLPVGIDWKPKGTDTVPAMLTPGEYVPVSYTHLDVYKRQVLTNPCTSSRHWLSRGLL